jgi:hypothetical protein
MENSPELLFNGNKKQPHYKEQFSRLSERRGNSNVKSKMLNNRPEKQNKP